MRTVNNNVTTLDQDLTSGGEAAGKESGVAGGGAEVTGYRGRGTGGMEARRRARSRELETLRFGD